MLPLLPQVGPFADRSPLPFEERRPLRRGAPEALRLEVPSPGWPPLLVAPVRPPQPLSGGGAWGWLGRLWRQAPRAGTDDGPAAAPAR